MASTLISDFASWFDASSQPRPRADRAITALPAMVQVLEARALLSTITTSAANLPANSPTITILGTDFDDVTPSNNVVTFDNGAVGTVTVAHKTELFVTFDPNQTPLKGGVLNAKVKTGADPETAFTQVALVTPVVLSNTASLPANADTITVKGYGFDPTILANNGVIFDNGASGTVTGAVVEPDHSMTLTITFATNGKPKTAGPLRVSVGSSGPLVQVATVTPVITSSVTTLPANATTLTINGFGFDPIAGNNFVAFNNGAVGTVTNSTFTTLTVTFAVSPTTGGPLTAIVTTNGVSSGGPVQVATVAPVITASTSPQAANATTVIITGIGFDPTNAANNLVYFSNDAVGVVSAVNPTGTQLTVTLSTLPTTAGPLKATVVTNGGSSGAKVQVATITPVLNSSKANLEANADTIVLTGFGFDQITPGNNKVTFSNGVKGDVTDSTATTLTVTFTTKPTTAGPLSASVTTNNYSSGPAVQVASVAPVVNSSTSPLVVNSKTVTITGYGFDAKASNNKVTFNNGAVGNVTAATATTLTVTFATPPSKAGALTAVVTTNGVSSEHHVQVATVTPAITPSVSPLAANATTVTIRGAGFDPIALNNKVTFDNGAVGYVKSVNKTGTLLTVAFLTQPTTAGVLKATVVVNGQNDGAAPVAVATVIPVVTSSIALLPSNATTLTINGYGFDPNSSSNKVTLSNGAVGTVAAVNATGTSMTVTLTSAPTSAGPIKATVITNGQSSGTPIIVATASPLPALPFNLPTQGGQSGLPKQLQKLMTPQKTQTTSILSLLTRRRR